MSRFKKIWELSIAEKWTLITALCGLPIIHFQIRLFGFEAFLSKLKRKPLTTKSTNVNLSIYPVQTSRIVNAAARLLFRREACLERSIMLWLLLRRKGIDSELKIGVATEDQKLQAHAWIEIDGEAINENPYINDQFAAFSSPIIADHRDFL